LHTLEGAELVRTMISMAQVLELRVIAEGVETQNQLEHLCKLGSDSVQGYYFAKPLPALEMEALLRQVIEGRLAHLRVLNRVRV
jgi:EAL domain-containing protein (putative c-di-GMP-specific phosphodiesterase class I)